MMIVDALILLVGFGAIILVVLAIDALRGRASSRRGKPQRVIHRPWEITLLGVSSGLVLLMHVYLLVVWRLEAPLRGSFLTFRMPVPLGAIVQLATVAILAYLTYGLLTLRKRAFPLALFCIGYLILAQIISSARSVLGLIGSSIAPSVSAMWFNLFQTSILGIVSVLVYVVLALCIFEYRERFAG